MSENASVKQNSSCKVLSLLLAIVLTATSFSVGFGLATPENADAANYKTVLENNYVKAKKLAGKGTNGSFSGWCGMGVSYEIYAYGITKKREVLGNGNVAAEHFKKVKKTTGGYLVSYAGGSKNGGWKALDTVTKNGTLNGAYIASYTSTTSHAGHVNFFIIDNGTVYITETFRFNGVAEGKATSYSYSDFKKRWSAVRYKNVLSAVRFYKNQHVHSYKTIGYTYKSYNTHVVSEKCSCGATRARDESCVFVNNNANTARVCSRCGHGAQPYSTNKVTTIANGTYLIKFAANTSFAAGFSTTLSAGSNVEVQKTNKSAGQQFAFTKNADGTYCITSANSSSSIYVGLAAQSGTAGTNVLAKTNGSSDWSSCWFVEKTSSGHYALRNKLSNLYFSKAGTGAPTKGQNIQQSMGGSSTVMQFILEPIKSTAGNSGQSGAAGASTSTGESGKAAQGNRIWHRLWGQGSANTMQAIVQNESGWANACGGTVVVATNAGYCDALTAAGVAGRYNAPVLVTAKGTLTVQAEEELRRIKPSRVIIVGGPSAIQPAVEQAIKTVTGANVIRTYGQTATDTAAELARKYFPRGTATDNTAILATRKGYYDALSASPVAYAKHYPIFLCEDKNTISKNTLSAMKACGIKKIIIIGGTSVVNTPIITTLKKNGITLAERICGQTRYDTSREVANWGIRHGMSANKMGVATSYSYYDALCGAALCGKNNAVLVIADAKNYRNTSVPKANKSKITCAYVFGGSAAVEDHVFAAFEATTAQAQNLSAKAEETPKGAPGLTL